MNKKIKGRKKQVDTTNWWVASGWLVGVYHCAHTKVQLDVNERKIKVKFKGSHTRVVTHLCKKKF